jgi:hypothetical protein
MPELYKNYMIVGVANRNAETERVEIERHYLQQIRQRTEAVELKQATFSDKITAQSDALRMCRYWIDIYGSELGQLLKLA